MPVQIMNCVDLIGRNIENSFSSLNDSASMNSNLRESFWNEQFSL